METWELRIVENLEINMPISSALRPCELSFNPYRLLQYCMFIDCANNTHNTHTLYTHFVEQYININYKKITTLTHLVSYIYIMFHTTLLAVSDQFPISRTRWGM